MCASQTDENGIFQQGSELGQILKENLIEEEQFYGVDTKYEVIQLNKKAKPKANWFHEDFITQMKLSLANKNFNPAIINADLLNLDKLASMKTAELL